MSTTALIDKLSLLQGGLTINQTATAGVGLQVKGPTGQTSNTAEFYANGSGTASVVVDEAGNVGIGTVNPTSSLHVNGSFFCPGILVGMGSTTFSSVLNIPSTWTTYTTTGFSITYTPKFATSKLLVVMNMSYRVFSNSPAERASFWLDLYNNGAYANAIKYVDHDVTGAGTTNHSVAGTVILTNVYSSLGISAQTFTLHVKYQSGTTNLSRFHQNGAISEAYVFEFAV